MTTKDVRQYAAEQGLVKEKALKRGLAGKSAEFRGKGTEVYAKA